MTRIYEIQTRRIEVRKYLVEAEDIDLAEEKVLNDEVQPQRIDVDDHFVQNIHEVTKAEMEG